MIRELKKKTEDWQNLLEKYLYQQYVPIYPLRKVFSPNKRNIVSPRQTRQLSKKM